MGEVRRGGKKKGGREERGKRRRWRGEWDTKWLWWHTSKGWYHISASLLQYSFIDWPAKSVESSIIQWNTTSRALNNGLPLIFLQLICHCSRWIQLPMVLLHPEYVSSISHPLLSFHCPLISFYHSIQSLITSFSFQSSYGDYCLLLLALLICKWLLPLFIPLSIKLVSPSLQLVIIVPSLIGTTTWVIEEGDRMV